MRWFMSHHKREYEVLREKTQLSPVTCLLLANRGVTASEAQTALNPTFEDLSDPFAFREMEVAVSYILDCLAAEIPIRIVGDYDQDGVAATTILMKGLRYFAERLGADPLHAVSYAIPDRMEDGYGISPSLVERAMDEHCGLIVTVDNGIAAFDALQYAAEVGMPVIVTDHHQPVVEDGAFRRPECEALINPHVPGERVAFRDLCGAGVAFKLVDALARQMEDPFALREELLGYAALGTICDVMPLVGENRTIVTLGLDALNRSTNPGLRALLQAIHWEKDITVYTAGFIIGPCINASGRLMTARLGVELFLEDDPVTVAAYAEELVRLNDERKAMTLEGTERAQAVIEKKPLTPVLVCYLPGLHESLCGLVAGRMRERYNRPSLVFTDAQNGEGLIKGSGRSIPAYHMFQKLNAHRDDYVAFGGHAMACGMTIRKVDLERLVATWNAESELTTSDLEREITVDGRLPLSAIDVALMRDLDALEPYGNGFAAPLFAAIAVHVRGFRVVGAAQNVLRVNLEQNGARFVAVAFQAQELLVRLKGQHPKAPEWVEALLRGEDIPVSMDVLYKPQWNTFRGQTQIELKLSDMRFSRV